MIKNFKHAGLEAFHRTGDMSGIAPDHAKRLRTQLGALGACTGPHDLQAPRGWALHPLEGTNPRMWSIAVSGNWRLTFRFEGKDVVDVDYLDYH